MCTFGKGMNNFVASELREKLSKNFSMVIQTKQY